MRLDRLPLRLIRALAVARAFAVALRRARRWKPGFGNISKGNERDCNQRGPTRMSVSVLRG